MPQITPPKDCNGYCCQYSRSCVIDAYVSDQHCANQYYTFYNRSYGYWCGSWFTIRCYSNMGIEYYYNYRNTNSKWNIQLFNSINWRMWNC